MKKTLVIHPTDKTTAMLEYVYKDKGYTVLNDPFLDEQTLVNAIKSHDKIIFLGHGLPDGLINPLFINNRELNMYLFTNRHAHLLKDKETVSVWCYSDIFFRNNNLKGFHTGMIISETMEAHMVLGRCPLSSEELYQNMVNFAKIIGECIEEDAHTMQNHVLTHYVGDDEITLFNRQNIIVLT